MKRIGHVLILMMVFCGGNHVLRASAPESQVFDEKQLPPEYRQQFAEMKEVLELNLSLMRLRSRISLHPEQDVSSSFSGLTAVRWRRTFKQNGIEPIFLSDFFSGCLIFTGPHNSVAAVSALYNPWWDAVLLLKSGRDNVRSPWKITSFELLSGEDFRKEKTSGIPDRDAVIARKGPQALAWMKLVKKTRSRFNECFSADPMLSGGKFRDRFPESSLKPVLLRAALRMKLHQNLMEHKGVLKEMGDYLFLLRNATPEQMKKVFGDAGNIQIFALFNLLGPSFRKTMTYYGNWISENARLYLYVSKRNPRIAAMVCVHVGKSVDFEWYDLDDSEKYIDAWNDQQKKESGK